ncbi:aldehyde dehydrogenase family protein [Thioalkalivibrio sp. HK1]|uniref:aldehyde dehydrogenase family protein n=1 Tax=Thioalkalivibrio sp. HK1 TaxID=1469245 RepID=UPI0004B02220|nr:aldehyde dehydrogenase family protein [Thioalkalivibrio sp. HK1]
MSYDADLESIAEARQAAQEAFEAWQAFLGTTPDRIDAIVDAMARAVEPEAERLASLAVEETGYGNLVDKKIKNLFNTVSVSKWLRKINALGMLWRDDRTGVAAFGEPMGVVAALIPVTSPTSTIIFKVLSAVKAGNAIVCAPSLRGRRAGIETVAVLAKAAVQAGAPQGLIRCLEHITLQGTAELMSHRHTAVVMATGGPGMVKAAYSSGKPTLAVGAGNVPCYVHRSMRERLDETAAMIVHSKSFDYGTACVAEQAVIADFEIARDLRHALRLEGGYFCTAAEADRLSRVIFQPSGRIDPEYVGQSASTLAKAADFSPPLGTRCLVCEENEIGRKRPLSAEKLNPVLAFYEARDADHGLDLMRRIVEFGGLGHSAVVHTQDSEIAARFAARLPVGRVLVNTPALFGGMGFSTDLDPSFMLGTGTWSGSITSDNVTALHLINIKRVAYQSRPWRDIHEEYGT